eukprot:UN03486
MAGSTVLCSYDNIEAIAAVCKRQNLWLHVDGCVGGSLMFSKEHKEILTGSRFTNSFTWNAHKLMGVPLQCTMLLVNKRGYLNSACATSSSYLFHDDNPLNHGERTLQCGRKGDAFKLWLFWKRYGKSGMENRVNKSMNIAKKLATKIRDSDDFTLVLDKPQGTQICFWWLPKEP